MLKEEEVQKETPAADGTDEAALPASEEWITDEELENLRFTAKYQSILGGYPQINTAVQGAE